MAKVTVSTRGSHRGRRSGLTALLAGLVVGFVLGLKPSNALFLAAPLVGLLIERKTTKRLSLKVVGDYLASWGMSPQRPMRRATERNEAAADENQKAQ